MTTMVASAGEPYRSSGGQARFLFGTVMATPVRLAYGLGPVIQILEQSGYVVAPLLAAAEIPPFALEEPSYRIRVEQEIRFTRLALERLRLRSGGLVVGQGYHLVVFGVLGLAAACAPSVHDMFRTMLSYPALAWGLTECSLWCDGKQGILVFEEEEATGDCAPFFVERDLTCALTLLRDTLGPHCAPDLIRFRHPPPPDCAPYEDYFRCPVHFGAAVNELRFDAGIWDATPPQANEMSYRFFDNQCRAVSEMLLEPLNYTDIVRSRLRSAVPLPSLPDLAAALRLTERTLQRRLAAEQTSFSALLRQVRFEQARHLMRRRGVHLEEIAYRLGFEDPVAFSHAFKQWTGISPRDFRSDLARSRWEMA